jgi:hypothetical protein
VKLRRLRDGDILEDENIVLVRGGELDPDVLSEDALRYHSIYGVYGISVFAVRDATLEELAQQVPLVRFERLIAADHADGGGRNHGWAAARADRPEPASLHRRLR